MSVELLRRLPAGLQYLINQLTDVVMLGAASRGHEHLVERRANACPCALVKPAAEGFDKQQDHAFAVSVASALQSGYQFRVRQCIQELPLRFGRKRGNGLPKDCSICAEASGETRCHSR
ncbi:MAG: hypothetical protein WDO56_30235 [Gammaproteobacteria bacterium]